ncbi:MAG TPA: MMPL family transporter [Actinomycetota bacterium]|nr:MMPL family transporter [Actinomycetota bacterium]
MLSRVGRFTVRRRKLILIATVVGFIAAGAIGGGVVDKLSSGGFTTPNAESTRAEEILDEQFGAGNPNLILLVEAKEGSVDDPAVAKAGIALTEELLAEPSIDQAFSYWSIGSPPPLRNGDATKALVLAHIDGDEDEVREAVDELTLKYNRTDGPITVGLGGIAEVFRQVSTQIESDLAKAEGITFPIIMLLLIVVFGSVIAAGLPLAVGAISVIGTFLVLFILQTMTDVSIFSINLTTAMGLGLGIDYSLFIVSRFREEMRHGMSSDDAVVRAVETAGRTVLFSALTVAISLAALLVFPLYFLRSFAYAGVAVVALASFAAIVFLPALLATIGTRIDKWVIWKRPQKEVGEGMWHQIAITVMRRPWPVLVVVVGLLLFLGAPFLGVKFGLPDDRVLPTDAPVRVIHDEMREEFESAEAASLGVVAPRAEGTSLTRDIHEFAAELSRLDGVARVDALTGSYVSGLKLVPAGPASARFADAKGTWWSVVPSVEPLSEEGEELVADIRAMDAPYPTLVTGPSAELVDSKAAIFSRVPLAALLIAIVTFAALFLMTGSILVPIKAVVMNLLSLSATYGAMVWIFQQGHLTNFLDFTATGALDTTSPILMFCIAFGLSMDYEVFLLSRIKEEHDAGADNETAVAVGLEKTGRIVTAAAALLAIVFIATATSKITFIKLFGVGLSLAVVMDATLIRGALVPAFMRLAGDANWWAPRPLKKLYDRWGISDADPEAEPAG